MPKTCTACDELGADVMPRAGEAVSLGVAAVGGVDLAEAVDELHSATARSRNLVARVPAVVVGHAEQREARRVALPRVAREAAELSDRLGEHPTDRRTT